MYVHKNNHFVCIYAGGQPLYCVKHCQPHHTLKYHARCQHPTCNKVCACASACVVDMRQVCQPIKLETIPSQDVTHINTHTHPSTHFREQFKTPRFFDNIFPPDFLTTFSLTSLPLQTFCVYPQHLHPTF